MTTGTVHSSGIPLSRSGWLSAGYMLTQADLEKWLAQLCRALLPLHEQNKLYGAVAPDHVLLDSQGCMQITSGHVVPVDSRAASHGLHEEVNQGYAAFEQYVDDPAWPQGPWTDIYGMSALTRSLILKQTPPDAVQRMITDTCVPLQEMGLPGYSPEFLGAIDQGMSLLPQQRFPSIDAFAETLGLSQLAASPSTAAHVPIDAGRSDNEKRKAPIWMIGCVVIALIATGAYLMREQSTGMQVNAVPQVHEAKLPHVPEMAAAPESEADPAPEPVTTADRSPEPRPVVKAATPIDMEAHEAARTVLLAAEQEAETSEEAALVDAASANVRVDLSIKPWGEIFINGVSQGVSPPLRSLSLTPGEYRVSIVNGKLPPQQQTLTVRAGKPAQLAHDFESGD